LTDTRPQGEATGPSLGLIVRLYSASSGRPDTQPSSNETDRPAWMQSIVTKQTFEARLDLAASIGARGIEVTQASQVSGTDFLLSNAAARDELLEGFARRNLVISALNCAAMPLHPLLGEAHRYLIRQTIRLAEKLNVRKIASMSGAGGDGPGSSTINWVFFPWPADAVELRERQWQAAIALWTELAQFASDHGVERIAFELHPLHLVYNVPTLLRMRDAVGPIVGANVDPSHLFWQQMDPIAVVRALGSAVYHVQLKDTQFIPEQMAVAGVLDSRSLGDPHMRAWIHRTVGRAHGPEFWGTFLAALGDVGYRDFVSIENEDPFQSYEEGILEAAAFIRPFLSTVSWSTDAP
jgi:sugar phosphate isomerase/epimerase